MIVKISSGANTVKNALFLRQTNNTWARYDIINSGDPWTRPGLALDETHQVLYVFGAVEANPRVIEMKRVAFGNYGSLLAAPREIALRRENDDFFAIGMPPHNFTAATNLLMVAENETQNTLWYRLLALDAPSKESEEQWEPSSRPAAGEKENPAPAVEVYPNPFNPGTMLRVHLREPARAKLQIFSISGQLVRTLVDEELPAGTHQRWWNGRNRAGEQVAAGIYIYNLQGGGRSVSGRMQLLR